MGRQHSTECACVIASNTGELYHKCSGLAAAAALVRVKRSTAGNDHFATECSSARFLVCAAMCASVLEASERDADPWCNQLARLLYSQARQTDTTNVFRENILYQSEIENVFVSHVPVLDRKSVV